MITVGSNPVVHVNVPTNRNLLLFTGSLTVLLIAATVIFGFYVLAIAAVSYAVAITIEGLFARFRKRKLDAAWMVTPLVLALLMPPTAPLWLVAIGSGFGVFFGKSIFGGLGRNVFNPALVGYLFVLISFPVQMTTQWLDPLQPDLITTATPLISLRSGVGFDYTLWQLLMGNVPGTLGETFRLGILVLGLLLIILKVIDWRIPLAFIGTVFVVTLVGSWIDDTFYTFRDPFMSLFVGGLMFGAFFVATDPVTAPVRPWGRVCYGIGIALITVVIRSTIGFPEGVTFAIIIMNAVTPLIDNWRHTPDGETVEVPS